MGQSLVIDLKKDSDSNRYRLIDHRSIDFIIYKNVKYSLKKGGKSFSEIDTRIPQGSPAWDTSKLQIGDMFSKTSYYQTVKEDSASDQILCIDKGLNDSEVWFYSK